MQAAADYALALDAYNGGDVSRALRIAKQAATSGSTDAAVLAGYILRYGEDGAVNLYEARRYYEIGAAKGHPDALVALGEMGIKGQAGLDDEQAYAYLTRASESGRTDATRALAEMNRTGRGVTASVEGQRELLERAAGSFDVDATKRLGDTYFETDARRALDYYEQAAQAGHVEAAYIAGVMYAENFDIRPDEERSAHWLGTAARGGHAAAQADYGLLVYQGVGAERSDTKAAEWFRKSAEGGDAEGAFLYAFTLAKGDGAAQDFEEAYYWALKSGESAVDDYQSDRETLRKGLEGKLGAEAVARVRARL